MARFLSFLVSVYLLGVSLPATAFGIQDVPEPLKPWVNWALADEDGYQCPFFYQDFQQKQCSWPGALRLSLNGNGGRFAAEWTLYRPDWLVLPGDQNHWPQRVISNQQPAVVIEHNGKPALWLPAGHYQIDGEFYWDGLPENLALAEDTGLVQLSVNNDAIAYPHIEQGALWLSAQSNRQDDPSRQDSVDLQVFRQVIDDIPLQVATRLELEVSGKARELMLPHALLPNFIPISLDSPLPAKLESDGRLRLQIRPGRWSLTLHARHPQPLAQLDLAIKDPDWPQTELWAFQAMPALRLVEVEQLQAVDGSQTNLPVEWRQLPTYQIQQGQSMVFKTIRRGDSEPEPNQLQLHRKLWLDFDGNGYTVSDTITGQMTRDWRLNTLPETQLGQVLLNGQNQLITQLADGRQGVELRHGTLRLQADSRIKTDSSDLSAVGWQQSFQQVHAELNVPPGWRLLAVSGVDNDPDSWLTHWTLLDLFLVLIVTLAVGRLWTWHWGILALVSLAFIWHEADAPQWIWLNILAALALLRVLPDNRFSRWVQWYRNVCWLILMVIVIPFMIMQIRVGLYPQLEQPWQPIQPATYPGSVASSAAQELAAPMAAMDMAGSVAPHALMRKSKVYSPVADYGGSATHFDRIDPEANLQTGPGLPQWQWHSVQLSWNGSVDQQQRLRLWFLSPPFSMLLHIVQALLAALLSLRMMGMVGNNWRLSAPILSVVLVVPLLFMPADNTYADMPDQQMLEQLKTRLLQPPLCLPGCAQLARMDIDAKAEAMQIELQIHARQDLAVPLPAQLQQWYPQQVSVDGHEAQGLIRRDDGSLWLELSAGVHKVVMQGRQASQYKFTLPLPLAPQYAQIKAEGWRVDGVYENGKVGPQLEFNRLNIDAAKDAQTLQQASLPPFIEVEKIMHLGIDWRLITRVRQLAGNASAVVLELPLLPGEAITSADVRVKDGKVLVNMAAGQDSLEWQSLLEKREQLELKAADTLQWRELWRADVSPIWHVQASGIATVHHQDQQGAWLPEWRPWPGETVQFNITRPQAVAGATLTIDKSLLRIKPGKRSELTELKLDLRSSKGGQHNISLPAGAELQNVSIDGASQPIRQHADKVTLPVHPGAQQISLNWQSAIEQSTVMTTPVVDLGMVSVNSHIQVLVGEERWVLITFGPKFGPAALIWGLMIVLLLLALGLGRVPLTPLRHWQWFLLLIGLSQIHIAAAMLVIGWLLALGVRAKHPAQRANIFNLTQVGLGFLSLLAILLLFAAVQQGLLGSPAMQIIGNQSTASDLNWYQDHSGPILPTATVIAAPIMLYRFLMLGWSLWMALSLLAWLSWGWESFSKGGIWIKADAKTATPLETSNDI